MPIKHAVGNWTSTNILYSIIYASVILEKHYCCRAGSRPFKTPLAQKWSYGPPSTNFPKCKWFQNVIHNVWYHNLQ